MQNLIVDDRFGSATADGQRRFDENPISSIEPPLLFAPGIPLTPSLRPPYAPRVFSV
jgi:hypothetical protein